MGENKKRAVRKNRLTDDEARLFRANYEFMWRTLGTTPYSPDVLYHRNAS